MSGLAPIWAGTHSNIDGVPLGDAWPCSSMPYDPEDPWESIVPLHKIAQWLAYSLMSPMTSILGVRFVGTELLTGLPDCRNAGLLIDTGLITLRGDAAKRGLAAYRENAMIEGEPNVEVVPLFAPEDDVIVEWRAVTVGMLDELLIEVNALLGLRGADRLSLAQMLEAGTWKVRNFVMHSATIY